MDDNRPRHLPLLLVLLFLFACVTGYVYMVRNRPDPDMFWRIKQGAWMVEHRQIPATDVLSWYGRENHGPSATQSWLFEILLYTLWRTGGYPLVYALATLLHGALAPLAYAWARMRAAPPMTSLIVGTAAAMGTMPFVTPRPHALTFCLLIIVAMLLEKRRWAAALALVVVGVNIHGGLWPMYTMLVAAYALPKRPLLVAGTLAAAALNPQPLVVLSLPFRTVASQVTAAIIEFAPTAYWKRPFDFAVLLVIVLATRRSRIPVNIGLFVLAMVVLSFSSIRHLGWIYVLVLPLLAPYFPHSGPAPAGTEAGERPASGRRLPHYADAVLAAVLGVAILAMSAYALTIPVDVNRSYPQAMAAYLRDHPADRMLNRWEDGGYLMMQGITPMIDTRGEPFGPRKKGDPNVLGDYIAMHGLRIAPDEFLDRYRVRHVMLPKDLPVTRAIAHDPRFKLEHEDATHVLYEYSPG